MASKRGIRRALEYLGWEVRWGNPSGSGNLEAVVGGYGPYRLAVRFDPDTGEPAAVLTYRVGSQGVFSERWRGAEQLPAPEEIVRRLSKRDAGRPPPG